MKLYNQISKILEDARLSTYRQINTTMIKAYWLIGQQIVEEEQDGKNRAEYGSNLIEYLSKKLTTEFGKSYSQRNLFYMKQFYFAFPKVNALRSELTWTHYRLLLKVQNEKARIFYLNEAVENQWSTRTLERNVNSFYYERLLSSQQKEAVIEEAEDNKIMEKAEDIIKDPYVLEFLQLKENSRYLESELEQELINTLEEFLLELGKGFSFVARQRRISAEGEHFYIDLVFYNFILKCFVLIDLKIGKLTHQDIGQMDFYVKLWEEKFTTKGDNPTLGIILCSAKNNTIVKYSMLNESRQLFASKYLLYLPTEAELSRELNFEKNRLEIERKLEEKYPKDTKK